MFKNLKIAATTAALSIVAATPVMAQDAVGDAASAFTTEFGTNAALIGAALIGGAFIAIGFKWVKAMVFGG